ncbi:MAG: tyrosine-type recombinase/integrase [Alphaproteobacteria bacterium]|nr:tyrosine-type recombinase/integrase [Alphaproteobacteria bacterium]
MTAHSPQSDLPLFDFVGTRPTPTFGEVVRLIEQDQAISANRKRNLASSIRRLCRMLGLPLKSTPATFDALRPKLARFAPSSVRMTEKRFRTVRSDVSAAIKRYADPIDPPPRPLTAEWRSVKQRLSAFEGRVSLGRFVSWCNDRSLSPRCVDTNTLSDFRRHLEHRTLKTSPQRQVRELARHWNKLADEAPDLGLQPVEPPSAQDAYAVHLKDCDPGFLEELEAWLTGLSKDADLFDQTAPVRPLKDSSIGSYRFKVRQFLGILVRDGEELRTFTRLADLLTEPRLRKIIGFFQDRGAVKGKITDSNVMHVLRRITSHCYPDDRDLAERLRRASGRVSAPRGHMGERPAKLLHQFDDQGAFDRLLLLPVQVLTELADVERLSRKQALDLQSALALELLLIRPIRRKNLASLRLGIHVHIAGDRPVRIRLPSEEVKNGVEHDYTLPAPTADMLKTYLERTCHIFGTASGQYLFPGTRSGAHKSPEAVTRQIQKFVHRRTGLQITVHLMRQITTRFYLSHRPAEMETARQLLGHRSLETTARAYVGLRNQQAVEH